MDKLTSETNNHKKKRKPPTAATMLLLRVLGLMGGPSGKLFRVTIQRDPFPVARRNRRYKPSHHAGSPKRHRVHMA